MATSIFVNLPVQDLKNSMRFYEALGYSHNPQFTDETAACIVISDTICVMLLTHAKFKEFTPKEVADATKVSEVLICLTCENREAVTGLVAKALAAGGSKSNEPKDYGFMYLHSFQDPDGHMWEVVWMDPAAAQPGGQS
jgi:uncharacterized protein